MSKLNRPSEALVNVPRAKSIVRHLRTHAVPLGTQPAKVYHLPNWANLTHPQRLAVIRRIALSRGRDPHIAKLAVSILRKSGAQPREYEKQAAALLRWIQDPANFYYVNEPGERLQDPLVTIKFKTGDCDDAALLLCALFESLGLPWRLVLSGRNTVTKEKIRFIEGDTIPSDCVWTHIYCMVGTPPFQPTKWFFCEPTVRGVPLGWDVVSGDHSYLPEMLKSGKKGPPVLMLPRKAPVGFRAQRPVGDPSPAYEMALAGPDLPLRPNNGQIGASVGASVAEAASRPGALDWARIGQAVVTGVAVSVTTQLLLDWVNGRGMWEGSGHLLQRMHYAIVGDN
jgi:hypothetical protein